MSSRQRVDKMKEVFANSGLYEDLMDAIFSVIDTSTELFVDEYGHNPTETRIALQEMIGLVDEYTTEEIDNEVAEDIE